MFLIAGLSRAESEWFERLFADHAQGLYGFLVYRTQDRALAEDVVADVFERALKARGRFDAGRGSEKSWLFAIALNRLRDLRRRQGAESRAVETLAADGAPFAGSVEEDTVTRLDVGRAMRTLPVAERTALSLRFGGDLTVPEVAGVLGEPLARIEGRVYRGLRNLRDLVEADEAPRSPSSQLPSAGGR